MAKNTENTSFSNTVTESKYDVRLLDKRLEHGFLTRKEREDHIKALESEAEYDFTSAEELDKQQY